MAGDWIKMDCSTPEKPEVLQITVRMGWEDPDLTVGKLFKLWRWFDQHTVDGNARGVTAALLDRHIGATGFVQAVIEAGWLALTEAGIQCMGFEKHNGATAKSRAQTAKRVASHRSNAEGNATTVTPALAREEKRREEKELSKPTASHPAGAGERTPSIPCPYGAIVDAYHQELPTMPRVRLRDGPTWTDRQKAMRGFWGWVLSSRKSDGTQRAASADEALTWIASYFARVRDNDFLMGRTPRSGEHANWRCDIDFLMSRKGLKQVIEKTQEQAA